MTSWPDDYTQKFFSAFEQFWPGRLKNEPGSELLKTWRDVAQKFSFTVAMAALRECFESQDRPVAPTPAAFRSVAVPMQRYANDRARLAQEEVKLGEKLMSAQDCAADDTIWESVFDAAKSIEHLAWLKKLRKTLAGGKTILEVLTGHEQQI